MNAQPHTFHCSFCGCSQHEAELLVVGLAPPGAACSACIPLLVETIAKIRLDRATVTTTHLPHVDDVGGGP